MPVNGVADEWTGMESAVVNLPADWCGLGPGHLYDGSCVVPAEALAGHSTRLETGQQPSPGGADSRCIEPWSYNCICCRGRDVAGGADRGASGREYEKPPSFAPDERFVIQQ